MKIKVFRFRVSNWTSSPWSDDKTTDRYKEGQKLLATEDDIERTVNDFICDKKNVSITVTHVDVNYHNNARGNTIDLIYTVMYE